MVRKIAPSTDPVRSLEELVSYAKELEESADLLHVDVMDGEFVERETIGAREVRALRKNSLIPLDCHLMALSPDIEAFIEAGANIVTLHYEAMKKSKLISNLKKIRKAKVLAGVSIVPETEVGALKDILPYVDLILIMSVEPGKSGQKFLDTSTERVREAKLLVGDKRILIEVDGGITPEVSNRLFEAGADILVSGSYVYNARSRKEAIELLRNGK